MMNLPFIVWFVKDRTNILIFGMIYAAEKHKKFLGNGK
jgi:hypothetical protein